MRLIAHRGLLYGPDPQKENSVASITYCLSLGLDVEIDVWYTSGWMLGHDAPTTPAPTEFLTQANLWIHAKNHTACEQLNQLRKDFPELNYFWHESDERVLTSQGYWWTQPGKHLVKNSVAVMPEWHTSLENLPECLLWNTDGICSDWISKISPTGIQ